MRRRFTGNKAFDIDINNYFTVVALEDNLYVYLSENTCEYCIDGDGNWKPLSANFPTKTINTGHTLSFRGNLIQTSLVNIGTFGISKKCNLKGNIMSMLFGDNASTNTSLNNKEYVFYKLFYNCTNIIDASELKLPATSLSSYCYVSMFNGCTSLTTAPELPATLLANSCYSSMFQDCTSLTVAPALPSTVLANNCYSGMFSNCTSLTVAPTLHALILINGCYVSMFNGCSSLVTAPELPATILVNNCYINMFLGCSKLNYIKMLATDISASSCLSGWVSGVSSTGTFVKNPAMTSLPTGTSGIPEGWTVQNA